jgi:hypothetical protein
MRVEKNGTPITSLEDWRRLAPPKSLDQWVEGRSAFELARAWCGPHGPALPEELRVLFEASAATRGLTIETVHPEHRIPFDHHGGEPRNADLAFTGVLGSSCIAVTIEAKADEPFGATISETIAAALERAVENPRSQGVRRIEDLVRAILFPRRSGQRRIGDLRYQLLTATAGTLAYALSERAATAVIVVHEFVTTMTDDRLHERNADDFFAFLDRLGGGVALTPALGVLVGPFAVPGSPLFKSVPALYVGKVVTNCRAVCA